MRYRKLDSNGDYTVGEGSATLLVNSPQTVAQAVKTRLLLRTGEWLLDTTEGTPYKEYILGVGRAATVDEAIKNRILGTPGVSSIVAYSSSIDYNTRAVTVSAKLDTAYGTTAVETTI